MESKENTPSDEASKKPSEVEHLTFYEVVAIIQSGDSEQLREVIEAGRVSDINMLETMHSFNYYTRSSLLMVACKAGFMECARVLLDHNADINYIAYVDHDSALKSACFSGSLDILNLIIERGVVFTDTIILGLFESDEVVCNTEIATILVEQIQNVNWEESRGSFLYIACRAGNVAVVQMLLGRGALFRHGRLDPLVVASSTTTVLGEHFEVVKLLFEWNTITERVSQERVINAFTSAAKNGKVAVMQYIIEYGVDANTITRAMREAVYWHHVDVAAFLLDHDADMYATEPTSKHSPWMCACKHGFASTVRMLLARGADPNRLDARGWSPLRQTLLDPANMVALLDHGADPNLLFADGSTALLEVMRLEKSTCVRAITVLLEHGADPNLADAATGETPLMRAALSRRTNIVKVLLERGADVTQVDLEGKSVLDMLGDEKYSEVVRLCSQYVDSKPVLK